MFAIIRRYTGNYSSWRPKKDRERERGKKEDEEEEEEKGGNFHHSHDSSQRECCDDRFNMTTGEK